MWMILGSICVVSTFNSLYSLLLFYLAENSTCHILTDPYKVSSITITQRSLNYVLWYYPIIWLFWPPGLLKKK